MKNLAVLAAVIALCGCKAQPAANEWEAFNSGNTVLDRFLTDIQSEDAAAVSDVVVFKAVGYGYPQYDTAKEYFAFIDDCALVSVKAAKTNSDLFWVNWTCSDGVFRQAFNTAYEAPKVMASEILELDSDKRREKTNG